MEQAQERAEDGTKPTLRVESLLENAVFKRRCSDRLLNLTPVAGVTDDLYTVCDVLPGEPTDEQLGGLAFRLSNLLEDVHRWCVDKCTDASEVGSLGPPMRLPITNRVHLKDMEAVAEQRFAGLSGLDLLHAQGAFWRDLVERETCCVIYLNIPRWSEPVHWTTDGKVLRRSVRTRGEQVAVLDILARRHGLRCVEMGKIPQLGE